MQASLTCSECAERINNFLWLNCSHHICLSCAQNLSKQQSLQKDCYQCTKCKSKTPLTKQASKYFKTSNHSEKKTKKKLRIKKQQQEQQQKISYFCLSCMQSVPEDFRQFHKNHKLISCSIYLLQIQHLLHQQQLRLTNQHTQIKKRIQLLNEKAHKKQQDYFLVERKIKETFDCIRVEVQKIQEQILYKLSCLKSTDQDYDLLNQLQKQERILEDMIDQIKVTLKQKGDNKINQYFHILDRTRKIETIARFRSQNNIGFKLIIDEHIIKHSLNSIVDAINIVTKPTKIIAETIQNSNVVSRYTTSIRKELRKDFKIKQKPSQYFDSLRSKIFTTEIQKLLTQQRIDVDVRPRSYLGQISNRSNRFDSHNKSTKIRDQIQKLSKQIRQKSASRRFKPHKQNVTTITL